MSYYIYSTLPADYCATLYKQMPDNRSEAVTRFNIKGGAQVAKSPSITDFLIHTPLGVVTECPDKVYEWLQHDFSFKHFVEKGFLKVETKSQEVEKVVGGMELPDKTEGAPLVERDLIDPEHNGISSDSEFTINIVDDKPKKRK